MIKINLESESEKVVNDCIEKILEKKDESGSTLMNPETLLILMDYLKLQELQRASRELKRGFSDIHEQLYGVSGVECALESMLTEQKNVVQKMNLLIQAIQKI